MAVFRPSLSLEPFFLLDGSKEEGHGQVDKAPESLSKRSARCSKLSVSTNALGPEDPSDSSTDSEIKINPFSSYKYATRALLKLPSTPTITAAESAFRF